MYVEKKVELENVHTRARSEFDVNACTSVRRYKARVVCWWDGRRRCVEKSVAWILTPRRKEW